MIPRKNMSRGRKLCAMINDDPDNIEDNNCPVGTENISVNRATPSSFISERQESPLPVSFNDTEMNAIVDIMLNDGILDKTVETNLETAHPSPNCSINHLDYDCDNNYCPYYIEKENLSLINLSSPEPLPTDQSGCTTPQANSPLSVLSENSPHALNKRIRKDKGNIRERHVKDWKDVKRKTLRNLGKEYNTRKGVIRPARKIGPPCGCRMKCFERVSEKERKAIFERFWSLGDREKQWLYLANLVTKKNKRRVYTDTVSKRKYTLTYKLPIIQDDLTNYIHVCKKIFLSTMSLSDQVVKKALEKMDGSKGTEICKDNRGRHDCHTRKITEGVIKSVCDHINSLQPVESHYCRKDSTKLYLDGDLNFNRLFEMYKEWLLENNYEEVATTKRQYRDIVNQSFKLGFHTPKKDQCDQCHIHKNNPNPTEEQLKEHEVHVANKKICRQLKNTDKRDSQSSEGKIVSATFDFQKILNAPHGQLSVLYYKRKLSVYNFTLFDLANKEAHCYMWHEGEAKRGANEVSSCLYDFIKKMHQNGAQEFRFWSDNCTGQNRNRIVFAFYVYVAQKFNVTIKHTFLEKGHTQQEGDSVHGLIERSSKNKLIYNPLEWFSLVRWAKQDGKPYNVIEMKHDDFHNFKELLEGRNWSKNINRETVHWNKIKEVRTCSKDPFKINYRYDLANDDFLTIAIDKNTRRRQKKGIAEVKPLYPNVLPIPRAKFNDLISLCNSGLIPGTYHNFFESLCVDETSQIDSDSE